MRALAAIATAAFALLAGHAVWADGPPRPDPFAQRLLGKQPGTDKVGACFVRTYDAAHLARHPKQKVTAMMLLVTGEHDTEAGKVTYSFSLGVKLRGSGTRYESAGSCNHAAAVDDAGKAAASAQFGCGVDCDGGGFDLALSSDDKSIVLTLPQAVSIWKKGEDDPEKWKSLESGEDDKEFRLDRASLDACAPIAPRAEEAAN